MFMGVGSRVMSPYIMREIDDQLTGQEVDLVVCPVRTDSVAQAAVTYFKTAKRSTAYMTVEPDTECVLWKCLTRVEPAAETKGADIQPKHDSGALLRPFMLLQSSASA